MAGALTFAQYKKKQQSCCGDVLETSEQDLDEDSACFTCPRRKKAEKDQNTVSIAEKGVIVSSAEDASRVVHL